MKREPLSGAVQQTRAQTMVVAARAFAGGETLRVTLLVVGMVVVSAVMGHRVLEAPAYAGAVVVPWWLLAACFAVTEAVVMHIQVKREAQAVSVSELPLVLGLFFVAPLELVLARLVGSLLVFVLLRRSSVLKTVFNAALVTLESCTALLVFHLVAGDLLGVGPREWVAAYAAALTANALGAVALGLVIAVYEGELSVRDLAREALGGQPVAPLVVTLALVAVNSLTLDPGSVYLLLGAGVVLVLGYRGYAALADRHLNLERLYHFSQAVTNSPASDELLHSVLRQACEILGGDHAELVFPGPQAQETQVRVTLGPLGVHREEVRRDEHSAWMEQAVLGQGLSAVLPRNSKLAQVQQWLEFEGHRDALVAPLRGSTGPIGMLVVADRRGEVRTFDDEDVLLLETLANQASVAMQKGELIERLQHDAFHDTLTALPNRTYLHEELQRSLAPQPGHPGQGFAVMILDLNGFKDVNDTLGHDQGDAVLVEVARRLVDAVGQDGLVGRLGGDEFAVVVPEVRDRTKPLLIADRIHAAMEAPLTLQGLRMEVGASVGVAMSPDHGQDPSLLLKRADLAMYDAKTSGRPTTFFERTIDTSSARKLSMASELREALHSGDITVHVQPQAEAATGAVRSLEALARWTHPQLGAVSPAEFIPVAERSGLIKQLTASVLEQGLRDFLSGQPDDVTLAVNLSARSLTDPSLVTDVAEALERHHIRPGRLILEVTESAVMADPTRAIALLEQLHALGVQLSVDDFGTGYSSLSYLKRLPVQEVKIDRSFVTGLCEGSDDYAIVRSIIDLGRNLGLEIVAEGVEDLQTWELLAGLGCTRIQGWYLSPPLKIHDATAWLSRRTARALPEVAA